MKKREKAASLIRERQELLKCPLCGGKMEMKGTESVLCQQNHCFDLSNKGYLNLLSGQSPTSYSKELFQARGILCEAGFYDPLLDLITQVLKDNQKEQSFQGISLLDAGCGEGSHLYGLSKRSGYAASRLFGIDIAKDSIQLAAAHPAEIIWCVADLAKLPFQDQRFDVILNILSPANYGEFGRVLKETGLVLKVVPGPRYLEELRLLLYGRDERAVYSNRQVVDYFAAHLDLISRESITYKFELAPHLVSLLIQMTPLTWGETEKNIQKADTGNIDGITVDLVLLVGKKK